MFEFGRRIRVYLCEQKVRAIGRNPFSELQGWISVLMVYQTKVSRYVDGGRNRFMFFNRFIFQYVFKTVFGMDEKTHNDKNDETTM